MNILSEREKAFESAFARDQELAFRARARRDKAMALRAAQKMNMSIDAAEAYAAEIHQLVLHAETDEAIIDRIGRDLRAAGHSVDEASLREEMQILMCDAIATLKST
jgi:hypothetical protein